MLAVCGKAWNLQDYEENFKEMIRSTNTPSRTAKNAVGEKRRAEGFPYSPLGGVRF